MKKIILCDLGGVLISLNWSTTFANLFGKGLSGNELMQKWLNMKSTHKFEEGLIDFKAFHKEFLAESGSNIKFEVFAKEFDDTLGDLEPDCLNLLKELKQYGTLAMLSNTNERHMDKIVKTGLLNSFDMVFLSHLMGMSKPSQLVFEAVRKAFDCSPKDIYFFDDSSTNVDAAIRFGFHAYRVESPQEILKIVKSLEPKA